MDIDQPIANLMNEWLFRYNKDWDDQLTAEKIFDWEIHKYVKPECGFRIYEYIEEPTIYDFVYPTIGAKEGLTELRKMGYRIVFVTNSTQGCAGVKFNWLKRWRFIIDKKDYVEAMDKSLIRGDYLVDDNTENVSSFKGQGVLFTQNHNKYSLFTPRVNDWDEVIRYFEKEVNKNDIS